MRDKALKRIDELLLKRAVAIIKDDTLKISEKKKQIKELQEDKIRLNKTL